MYVSMNGCMYITCIYIYIYIYMTGKKNQKVIRNFAGLTK